MSGRLLRRRLVASVTLVVGLAGLSALATRKVYEARSGTPSNHVLAAPRPPASEPRPPQTYDEAVAELALARRTAEALADAAPGSWTRRAKAVTAQLSYAQLTGDYDAYAAAVGSLDESFRVARRSLDHEAVGPLMLKAQLSYELHRMQDALDSLSVPARQAAEFNDKKQLSDVESLRGAVTFAMGNYADGLAMLERSVELEPTAAHKQRLALALAKVGRDDEASRLFDATDAAAGPRSQAWAALQRGLMHLEHGRRADARRHFEAAVRLFPGGFQAEEHLAELDADEGRDAEAIAAYRTLVQRTNDPEFMDALARLLASRAPSEAEALRERASDLYEQRLGKLPEATYGHALEHFLRMVDDPKRAVMIAQKNRDLRPDGEASTRLAQAYIRAGRFGEAKAELDKVLQTPWTHAETWATAAVAYRLTGDREGAAKLEAKAAARNPHAKEEIAWLKPAVRS